MKTKKINVRVDGDNVWLVVNDDREHAIALMYDPEYTQLFLAAPALVEALEEAITEIKLLSEGEKCEHESNICWCETFQRIENGEKALALAKGKGE